MKLARVVVRRFKGIGEADFNLSGLNMLVGPNNSGKTSIIQAIHFAFTLFQSLSVSNKWPVRNRVSATISPDELFYIPSQDPYSLGPGGKLLEDREQAIELEFYFDTGNRVDTKIRKGRITNLIVEPTNVDFARTITSLEHPFSIYSPGLAGVSRSEQHVSNGVMLRALARGDANSFLRNILLRLHASEAWNDFIGDLSQLFPHIEITVRFNSEIDQHISVNISRGDDPIPLDLAGTGLLQSLQILSYLHLFRPRLILLDEPDSHLHPNNQRLLCSLLQIVSTDRNIQVIGTTHSRHMLDSISNEANVLWARAGAIQPTNLDDRIEVLLELGALDVRERITAGDFRFIFLTEDSRSDVLTSLVVASGFHADEFTILPYKGVTNVHLLEPLVRQIRQITQAVIVVHRDRDFLLPLEAAGWQEDIRAIAAEPFVTQEKDIEGYFVSDEALRRYCAPIDNLDADLLLERISDGQEDAIIAEYINGRIDVERKNGNVGRVNHGQLGAEAARIARQDPRGAMKGKTKLRRVRHILQTDFGHRFTGINPQFAQGEPTLTAIRQRFR